MEQMTYWCHLTAAADDDNETTSSVRRLIHTIVMPQKLQSQWKFDDVKYQLMTNDKPLTQVCLKLVFLLYNICFVYNRADLTNFC